MPKIPTETKRLSSEREAGLDAFIECLARALARRWLQDAPKVDSSADRPRVEDHSERANQLQPN